MSQTALQFGSFVLDLDRLCLRGPDGEIELRPKSFEVLRYMVQHPGRVVAKDELMAAVWPDVTVTDDSLTRCISEVRRAIGDESQRILKTVPRRGYLLDVPVSPGSNPAAARAGETTRSTLQQGEREADRPKAADLTDGPFIAVLPFEIGRAHV